MSRVYEAFLAALQERARIFPLVTEAFAEAVTECSERAQFLPIRDSLEDIEIFDTAGFSCPEFDEFIAESQAIGSLNKINPTYSDARARLTADAIERAKAEYGENWELIQQLANEYLNKVGWREDITA